MLSQKDMSEGYDAAEYRLTRCEAYLWQGRIAEAFEMSQALARAYDAAGWRWLTQRARLFAIEAQLRMGDVRDAAASLALCRDELQRRGYAAEAARAGLLGAAIARCTGDPDAAMTLLQAVERAATKAGLNLEAEAAELAVGSGRHAAAGNGGVRRGMARADVPGRRLARRFHLDQVASIRIREPNEIHVITSKHLAEWQWKRYDAVFDLVERRLKIETRWVDLARRDALAELVRALSACPGEFLTAEELVKAVWNTDYHPIRHHGRVTTAVSRLRAIVGGPLVEGSRAGYRLAVPPRWVVVERL